MVIASCLVDTNILLRISRRSDPQHKIVDSALAKLATDGAILYFTHQNIAELWNAMTRPVDRNGLGLSIDEADREVRAIESGLTWLPDSEAVYREWRTLLVRHAILASRSMTPAWPPPCTFTASPTSLPSTSRTLPVSPASLRSIRKRSDAPGLPA